MRAGGIPATTIGLRTNYVTRLARENPQLLALDAEMLTVWIAGHRWAPNTRKSARSALRSFYTWARITGKISLSPADALPAVRVPRGRARPTPESAYRSALIGADRRLSLALRLGAQCGLRRGEMVRLRREDVVEDLAGWSLHVLGKGGNVRLVPLPDDLASELRAREPGWVFPSSARPGKPLTANHLGKLIGQALPDGVTAHSLRHRCATVAYAATRDLVAVQDLLGHAKPETTRGYVQTPADAVRAAVAAAAAA